MEATSARMGTLKSNDHSYNDSDQMPNELTFPFAHYPVPYYLWKGNWLADCRYETLEEEPPEPQRQQYVHRLLQTLLEGDLHHARLRRLESGAPFRVLSIGSGTGLWAHDMASRHPNAEVVAMDLVQPAYEHDPPNYRSLSGVDFNEGDWGGLQEASFDYIHISMLCGRATDWPALLRRALWYLKPYTGVIEIVEMDWEPRSDPLPFPVSGNPLSRWYTDLRDASDRAGLPIAYPHSMEQFLKDAGFADVGHQELRCPYWGGGDPLDHRESAVAEGLSTSTHVNFEDCGTSVYTTMALPHFVKHLGR
ncbi:uncharacterized protein LTR77_004058 [Saxophila tyrrhenica]|uniref:S-adenosyl-L-methionine-dependent methyltransferase n=1 Tax=Saxophila tyrrhenica TaxID=1690608 RepID=A0AAV9PBJ7_9PEZI|nr:hypothetical protein LTR77_004058 [Saxophila tyrrhenica]